MAIPKICGIETEYGISARETQDFNPILTSSLLINAYVQPALRRVRWDYEEESPLRDARGFERPGAEAAVEDESGLVNVILPNGARYYVDHAHPEYSTPECTDAWQGALHDKAGELVLERAAEAATATLSEGLRILIHKNNSDGKGNSYGAHENYLVSRAVPFGELVRHLTPFLVSRQVFTGSGKVGSENERPQVDFQISQRADFFEEEIGLETTLKRPIINTRDEPHADPAKYRRLHVIIGDANLSEVQTFLKLGSASFLLAALEAGNLGEPPILADPVEAVWKVSHDPTLRQPLRLADGGTATALELQWHYLDWVSKHAEVEGATDVERRVLEVMPGALVIRTSAFFGPWDAHNFVVTTLQALRRGQRVAAVDDIVVSPTYVPDLVNATLDLLMDAETGLWHLANGGTASWYDFAREAAEACGERADLIDPVSAADRGWPAARPPYSALASVRGGLMRPREQALAAFAINNWKG